MLLLVWTVVLWRTQVLGESLIAARFLIVAWRSLVGYPSGTIDFDSFVNSKNKEIEAGCSDNKTQSGDRSKLGTISWAKLKESSKMNPKFIANIYGQFSPSTGERAVNYEAIARGIETIMKGASGQKASKSGEYIVGFPCRMGCDLARGEWPIIRQMIWTYALKYEVKTIIVDYNG